jgi:arylsulfatase
MTDNGPQQYRYTCGLRAKKGSVYEGGIRVPCFMNWEGRLSGDTEIATPAANIDILPTLLDMCGIQIPEQLDLDGRSLLPLLEGRTVPWEERTLFFEWARGFIQPYRNIAVRRGRYKLVGQSDYTAGRSVLELYDIDRDPYEQNDISGLQPAIVKELADEFDQWYSKVIYDEPLATPPRIIIGTDKENPVTLSRQDWKGPKAKSWRFENAYGYWDVSFARKGLYDVRLISPGPVGQAGTAYVRAGTTQRSRVNRDTGTSIMVLEAVPFRQGDFRFETWYDTRSGIQTPMYVEIKYIEPGK